MIAITLEQVTHKAIELLAQRNYCESELRTKLLRYFRRSNAFKHSDPESAEAIEQQQLQLTQLQQLIDQTVTVCRQRKWLNDESYLEEYIRMRRRKGYGEQRIIYELQQRGFRREQIMPFLAPHQDSSLQLIESLIDKRFARLPLNEMKARAKVFRFLLNRGFSSAQIKTVLAKYGHADSE